MSAALRVLIIEDEPRYRTLLAGALRDMDCEPSTAATAMEALGWLARQTADVVMLDLNLPVIDGLSFLDQFRPRHPETPVIILTGAGTLSAAQAAIRHRVTDFLTKPCHLGDIEAAIDRARREVAARHVHQSPPPADDPIASNFPENPGASRLDEIQRQAILAAIARHDGNRSKAAAELGISRRTLQYRIAEYKRRE